MKTKFWAPNQIAMLSQYLRLLDDLLEKMIKLHVSTPDDEISKKFNQAAQELETGYSRMVAILAQLKGMKIKDPILYDDVVRDIMEKGAND